jgi:YggT family protein
MLAQTSPILRLLCVATTIYLLILLIKVILSWVVVLGARPPTTGPARTAIDLVDDVTEPALRPLRNLIPPVRMGVVGLDLSMIVLFVILFVIRSALGC